MRGAATFPVPDAAESRRPLWLLLALLVLTTALPLLLASLFMFARMAATDRENIRRTLMVNAKTVVGLVESEIETHAAIAFTLSKSLALQADNLPQFWEEARLALEFVPGAWLAVSNPQGQTLLNTLTPPGTPLPPHPAPSVIERGFAMRRYQVGELVFGPADKRMFAFVEVPVFRRGAPAYSLSVALIPSRILELITPQFTHGEVIGIVDSQKKFVARIPDHDARVGTLASDGWRAAMEESPEGWTQNKTLEGNLSLTAYARTAQGWTVGVAQLEANIAKPFRSLLRSAGIAGAALTLLSLGLAALLARRASAGMGALAAAARALGEGRPVSVPPAPFSEAGVIGAALAGASAELTRRSDLLARANSDLETRVSERTAELAAEMNRRADSEATLRQTQKIESIGLLTGGIAHDFNNMLTVIMGNLETMQRRLGTLDGHEGLARPLEAAMQGGRSAARLTHRLLAYARQQPLEPVPLDLNALVASLAEMLARTLGDGIALETISGAGLWQTLADPSQVENALVNLVNNARDAMDGKGKLTIETANAVLDQAYAARFGDIKAGDYVKLSVSDTGTGIPAEKLEKVFEPFFTTKDPGKGTGLGLAMIHGFVKQSGGHSLIHSEVGKGTRVTLYLPRLTAARQES